MIQPLLEQMQTHVEEMFGGDEGIGMDAIGFISDMPLGNLLMFVQDTLPTPVEEAVAGLLQQAHAVELE